MKTIVSVCRARREQEKRPMFLQYSVRALQPVVVIDSPEGNQFIRDEAGQNHDVAQKNRKTEKQEKTKQI